MNLHRPIQILLVEDAEADGLLLAANLKAHGLVFNLTRVEELEPLRTELLKPGWDILLTDFDLPGMDGFQVIGEAARLAPGLPCILVSGQIGEEAAVEALRAGAKDFVCKDRLMRLFPAIQRELGESRFRVPEYVLRRLVPEGDPAFGIDHHDPVQRRGGDCLKPVFRGAQFFPGLF
ncbi:MAG TPA: response regulator, partial [Geothrix sp.]